MPTVCVLEIVGHLNAGTCRFLALIAEYDRLRGWSDGATHSCAHWLNWKCGLALGAARERLRVAHALENLPQVCAAMARGEISYSKVRAITRVASPATEDYFLGIARHGTAHHVETLVRLSNLVTLCRFHHRVVHEGRVAVQVLDDGALRFVNADGESYGEVADSSGTPFDWTELVAANRANGAAIDSHTAATRWRGERMDCGMAIETLLRIESRA